MQHPLLNSDDVKETKGLHKYRVPKLCYKKSLLQNEWGSILFAISSSTIIDLYQVRTIVQAKLGFGIRTEAIASKSSALHASHSDCSRINQFRLDAASGFAIQRFNLVHLSLGRGRSRLDRPDSSPLRHSNASSY
jgi:hypothetical protein